MKEDDFLFSKELRDRLSKFENVNISELITKPEFYIELCKHVGMDLEETKDMFRKVGRTDIAENLEEEEK